MPPWDGASVAAKAVEDETATLRAHEIFGARPPRVEHPVDDEGDTVVAPRDGKT